MQNIVVSGGSGAIGAALVAELAERHPQAVIHCLSRRPAAPATPQIRPLQVDYQDESSLDAAAAAAAEEGPVDLAIAAGGILHQDGIMPEKALRELTAEKLMTLYSANTVAPALLAKHFLPLLPRDRRAVFAAISARVGSISDNQLGGWYSYRASKAALNMILRSAAIETARRNPEAIVAGLHPGTVDSALSQPFQRGVPEGKLFTPEYSAARLIDVLAKLIPEDSGHCFAWDGQRIEP